jgi:hypothetical protein
MKMLNAVAWVTAAAFGVISIAPAFAEERNWGGRNQGGAQNYQQENGGDGPRRHRGGNANQGQNNQQPVIQNFLGGNQPKQFKAFRQGQKNQNWNLGQNQNGNQGNNHRRNRRHDANPNMGQNQNWNQGQQQQAWNNGQGKKKHGNWNNGGNQNWNNNQNWNQNQNWNGRHRGGRLPPWVHGNNNNHQYYNGRRHHRRDGYGVGLLTLGIIGALAARDYDYQDGYYYPEYNGYDSYAGYQPDGQLIRCESHDYRVQYCPVPNGGQIDLYRKISSASCHYGRDWGIQQGAIWVRNGCRADFVIY